MYKSCTECTVIYCLKSAFEFETRLSIAHESIPKKLLYELIYWNEIQSERNQDTKQKQNNI